MYSEMFKSEYTFDKIEFSNLNEFEINIRNVDVSIN
jgi:hypothetical protein